MELNGIKSRSVGVLKLVSRSSRTREVELRPEFHLRPLLFPWIGMIAVFGGCESSDSSSGYHEIKPAPRTISHSENNSPQPTGSQGESPKDPPAESRKNSEVKELPENLEKSDSEAGVPTTATLRMQSKAVPNPLAGGDDGPVRLLIPEKTFLKKGNALVVTYDDLDLIKVLNLKVPEPNVLDLLPDWLKKLDGEKIQIRGFMYPTFQEEGLDRFVFCRDTGACCFGPNPVIYYLIDVRMREGMTTHYIQNRPFDVTGTLRIKPGIIQETGLVYELYHLEDAVVRER